MGMFDWLSGKPGRDEFAKIYRDFLLRHRLAGTVQYDAARFSLQVDGQTLGLDNPYREYCAAAKDERVAVLQRYGALIKAQRPPDNWEEAKPRLLPSIRSASLPVKTRLMARLQAGERASQAGSLFPIPIGQDAVAMVAYDSEQTMMLVDASMQQKWGVSADQVWAACRENLIARSSPSFRNLGGGVLMSTWDDSYDSSRIILSTLLDGAGIGANPLIMIPTRGCLLLAPADDSAITRMIGVATERVQSKGRYVSSTIFQYHNGGLMATDISGGIAGQKLREFRSLREGEALAEQKTLLDQVHTKEGKDQFVASFRMAQSSEYGLLTSVIWTKDVNPYLHKADILVFCILDKSPAQNHYTRIVWWGDAEEMIKDMMTPVPDTFPQLYHCTAFPTLAQLESLPAGQFS